MTPFSGQLFDGTPPETFVPHGWKPGDPTPSNPVEAVCLRANPTRWAAT